MLQRDVRTRARIKWNSGDGTPFCTVLASLWRIAEWEFICQGEAEATHPGRRTDGPKTTEWNNCDMQPGQARPAQCRAAIASLSCSACLPGSSDHFAWDARLCCSLLDAWCWCWFATSLTHAAVSTLAIRVPSSWPRCENLHLSCISISFCVDFLISSLQMESILMRCWKWARACLVSFPRVRGTRLINEGVLVPAYHQAPLITCYNILLIRMCNP